MKTIEINGEIFEIKKVNGDRLSALTRMVKSYAGFDLDNYYAKSSNIKRNIWWSWRTWSLDCADCMIRNYFGVTGAIIITKSHNYLYVLK